MAQAIRTALSRLPLRHGDHHVERRQHLAELHSQAIANARIDRIDRWALVRRNLSVYADFVSFPQPAKVDVGDTSYDGGYGINFGKVGLSGIFPLPLVLGRANEFGPSPGYFMANGLQYGGGEREAYELMLDWVLKVPPSFAEYIRQSESNPTDFGIAPALEPWLKKGLEWRSVDDPMHPYEVGGSRATVRFLRTWCSKRIEHRVLRLLQIWQAQDHFRGRTSRLMSICHTGGLLCRLVRVSTALGRLVDANPVSSQLPDAHHSDAIPPTRGLDSGGYTLRWA